MGGVQTVLFLLCASSSTAFFFQRNENLALANGPVDQACVDLAEHGSCEFYRCFENRLRCGRDGYMVRIGQHYCSLMESRSWRFTLEGQHFINGTQRCLTQAFKDLYQMDHVNCVALENTAITSITTCFVENAFCDVFQANSQEFLLVYDFNDLFFLHAARVWRAILSLAVRCGHEAIREISSNTGETVIDSINNFFNSLTDIVN